VEVLRISTAGSVDDGKSTLIGRLLYETNSIPTDKLEAIDRASQRKGINFLDLSLLTDGLIAEREQGITIDVAHIYFQTRKRKFIITDAPGHVEYTRNMITGASKSDVSIILVDARKGILEQTHRHYFISNLLRIPKVIVCVNKMDLVNFEEAAFRAIEKDFLAFANQMKFRGQEITVMPVSSLLGDNVTKSSASMPWFNGTPLLDILETIQANTELEKRPARFPVQYVIRPRSTEHHDFRGYAGRVLSGTLSVGDEVLIQPSGRKSKISRITRFDKVVETAHPRQSVTIELENDVDISRGDWLVNSQATPALKSEIESNLCWLVGEPFNPAKTYLLQHGTSVSKAKVTQLNFVITPSTLEKTAATSLKMNDIAHVRIKTARPLLIDSFDENKPNGSFILVDEHTNNTVAVGFHTASVA
jgi:sulfate adenylyltransferase subunit 1